VLLALEILSLLLPIVARQLPRLAAGPLDDLLEWEPDFTLEFLERNSRVMYPALALLAVGILALGILVAWRSEEISGMAKVELKREIINSMRLNLGGVTVDDLAKPLKLKPLLVSKVIEEMKADGIVVPHTNARGVTVWRLRGIGSGS
jgi:hypothetical protein